MIVVNSHPSFPPPTCTLDFNQVQSLPGIWLIFFFCMTHRLVQGGLDFNEPLNHPGILFQCRVPLADLGWGPRFCIPNKLSEMPVFLQGPHIEGLSTSAAQWSPLGSHGNSSAQSYSQVFGFIWIVHDYPGDSDVRPSLRTAGGPLSLQPLPASSSSPLAWPAHTTSALCSWIPFSLVLDIHEELTMD